MNKSILLAFILMSSGFVQAQSCCPVIDSVKIVPSAPLSNSFVKIFTYVQTTGLAKKISTSFNLNTTQKTIDLFGCYSVSITSAVSVFADTFNIGMMPPGIYTVNFNAYESSSQSCIPIQTNSVSFTLAVAGTSHLDETNGAKRELAFPNPVADLLILPNFIKYSHAAISAVNGMVLKRINSADKTDIDVSDLAPGVYFIDLYDEGVATRKKFIKTD